MEFALKTIGVLAASCAAVGILVNLFVFSYELFVGHTISFLPVVPSVALGVALASLKLVHWYWALAIAAAYFALELFTVMVLIDRFGASARKRKHKV